MRSSFFMKKRVILLGLLVGVIGLTITIVLRINAQIQNTTSTVMIFIFSIMTMFSLQSLISSLMNRKFRKKKYTQKEISFRKANEFDLENKGYKKHNIKAGTVYIKIDKNVCYKVVFIKNIVNYYQNNKEDAEETKSKTKGIENCDIFVGFEIFYEYDEKLLNNIGDFSYASEKLIYEGFYFKDPNIVEGNIIDFGINDNYRLNLFKDLGFKYVEYDKENTSTN